MPGTDVFFYEVSDTRISVLNYFFFINNFFVDLRILVYAINELYIYIYNEKRLLII